MTGFVQIHTLRDYASALPNRGQDGLAKRAPYGGVERQRISSQSIKAALRADPALVRAGADGSMKPDTLRSLASEMELDMSLRSAAIFEKRVQPALAGNGFSEDDAKNWAHALAGLWRKEGTDFESDTPLVIGEAEVRMLVQAAGAMKESGTDFKKIRELFDRPSALKKAAEPVQNAIAALRAHRSHAGIDGALFGRMATGVALYNVDSAVHVAHALTVHPLASVGDFFSVQDDLKDHDSSDQGGSHINTAELTSGLFYNYAVVDLQQLTDNFAELSPAQRVGIVAWLVRAFGQAEPAAKRGSTAPYAGLREVVVEVGRRQPRSLMGAFELPVEPVTGQALSAVARERLKEHIDDMDALCGKPAWRGWLRDFTGSDAPAIEAISDAVGQQASTLLS